MKFVAIIVAGVAAQYDEAWKEFQLVQGARNGDIPAAFKKAVDFVTQHNSQNSSYKLSYTGPFAAHSDEDYKAMLGYKPSTLHGDIPRAGVHEHSGKATVSSIDWSSNGAVTPIKDQGQCGSCWSFSSTGGLEGQWQLATGQLEVLSEQQLVDCSTKNNGCSGGLMDKAFTFYESTDIATGASYPYTATDGGACKTSGLSIAIPSGGVTGYTDVSGETGLLDAVATVGPVSVAVDADPLTWKYYSEGVITGQCGTALDHGVLAVGFGTMDGTDYWKVKNSWGASWGASGYVFIQRGTNKCGIGIEPSYPTVDASAPPTPPVPTPPAPTPPAPPAPTPTGVHYGAPPCQVDEDEISINGGAVCAATCSSWNDCPNSPSGTSASRDCTVPGMQGHCGLRCGRDSGCQDGAKCMKSGLFEGVCAFSTSEELAPSTPPAPTPPAPTPPALTLTGVHYGMPPCRKDEDEISINGGVVCAAKCPSFFGCPKHPSGAAASTECKDGHCVLWCGQDPGCQDGAKCMGIGLFGGICAFSAAGEMVV